VCLNQHIIVKLDAGYGSLRFRHDLHEDYHHNVHEIILGVLLTIQMLLGEVILVGSVRSVYALHDVGRFTGYLYFWGATGAHDRHSCLKVRNANIRHIRRIIVVPAILTLGIAGKYRITHASFLYVTNIISLRVWSHSPDSPSKFHG
jgi:hypothetical protein